MDAISVAWPICYVHGVSFVRPKNELQPPKGVGEKANSAQLAICSQSLGLPLLSTSGSACVQVWKGSKITWEERAQKEHICVCFRSGQYLPLCIPLHAFIQMNSSPKLIVLSSLCHNALQPTITGFPRILACKTLNLTAVTSRAIWCLFAWKYVHTYLQNQAQLCAPLPEV